MKWRDIKEDGRIVKGVNTTVDVGTDEIKKQAAKFGFKVDKDGRPQNHPTKIKGKSTNVLFNLGLAESVAIKFERTDEYDILHIKEKGKNRVEVRGKKGYESGNYDPKDKLHRVLDKLGKAANISELMNGETVVLNPKHPDGPRAIKTVTSECPRTKASSCQCESVNKVTEAQETVTAVCELYPNDNVEGTILFKQQPNKPTLIIGEIKGLSPGKHGFHIHEFGDLSKGCESAGGHYNPDRIDHGDLSKGHVGDLGNITADENGIAEIRIVAKRVDLLGERSVVGRSVVVHSDVDDLGRGDNEESLKTGNAGDRLACGVIVMKETVNETTVYSRDELPQIKNKQLSKLKHTIETVALADIIPVQEERIVENFKRQVDNIVAGKYKPIIVDYNNKIVNGHHRYTALEMLGYESIEVARLPWSLETILEKWSQKYKRSINCNNPKGFSQKAHCQGRKKKESIEEGKLKSKSYKKAVKAAAMQGKRPKKKLKTKFSENFAKAAKEDLLAYKRIIGLAKKAYETNEIDPYFYDAVKITFDMNLYKKNPKLLSTLLKVGRNLAKEDWPEVVQDIKKNTGIDLEAHISENFAEGNLLANPQNSVLVKKEYPYDWYKIGTQIANLDNVSQHIKDRNRQDIYIQFFGGEKEKEFMMKKLGAIGYDVQDADGYRDMHFDENTEGSYILRIRENFADGKTDSKSRPGRVKRSGASCNGSVTALRKRAKNASGEKAKMYHWCANMKSGRKK